MTRVWKKSDWRAKPRVQMPDYPDQDKLAAVEARLSKYPPLVFAGESRRLKAELAKAARGVYDQAIRNGRGRQDHTAVYDMCLKGGPWD